MSNSINSIIILFKIAYLVIPTLMPTAIPFCFVLEATQTLNSMHNDSELLIIDNTGTSRIALIKPILLLAATLSIFLFIVENVIEPKCRVAVKRITSEATFDFIFSSLEAKLFFRLENNFYIRITNQYPNNILEGIFVADFRDPKINKIYYANSGLMDFNKKMLILSDGKVQNKTLPSKNMTTIKFDSYALNLKSIGIDPKINIKAKDRDLPFLLNPDPNDSDYDESMAGEYRQELHQRLTKWLLPIIFGLVAVASIEKNGSSRKYKKIHPTFISLLISFVIFWSFFYIIYNISSYPLYIPILYIFLLCILSILSFAIIKKHSRI